jgi:phospholipase C
LDPYYQHPDHDVRLGEGLLKEVYEDLRASPKWNNTLFIVTYDEHGGFYDHVPPPMNVPAPDASSSFPDKGFNFTRLGVRVPTLLISPWIPKGTVISAPFDSEKPQPNSEFDLTSIISSVKNLFGAPNFLTKRDAWAATFDKRLTEKQPRTDCPILLPDAPKTLGAAHAAKEAKLPLNDLQQDIVSAFATLSGDKRLQAQAPKLQGEAGEWISRVVDDTLAGKHVFANDARWQALKRQQEERDELFELQKQP